MPNPKSPFGPLIGRAFNITGFVACTRFNLKTGVCGFLLVPSLTQTNKVGIWVNGQIPGDRNPRTHVFRTIQRGQAYTFRVIASGDDATPDGYRLHILQIVADLGIRPAASTLCTSTFAVKGVVTGVSGEYVRITSRVAKDANNNIVATPAKLSLYSPEREIRYNLKPGDDVWLKIYVRPSARSTPNGVAYEPVLQLVSGFKLISQPELITKSFTRKAHQRTLADGRVVDVKSCTVKKTCPNPNYTAEPALQRI